MRRASFLVSRGDPLWLRGERLASTLKTPFAVQRWLFALDYNYERGGETNRSFFGVLEQGSAHCFEGALAGAWLLERLGHRPFLMYLVSADDIGHILALFRERGRWGAVGTSKYPGLRGRKPAFRSVRDLAWSYVDPFVDKTGRVLAYATLRPDDVSGADWRRERRSLWRLDRAFDVAPTTRLRASRRRHLATLRRYLAWRAENPVGEPPTSFYEDAALMW